MNRRVMLSRIALGALLAGCAGQAMVYDASDPIIHIDNFYTDGVSGRDLTLVVDGNPFNVPDDSFARQVEADLGGNTIAQRGPAHPVLAPGPSAKTHYKLVYVFEPRDGLYGDSICYANDPAKAAPIKTGTGTVTAVAAFCQGYHALSYVTGRAEISGPDDARLVELTRLMEDAVFRPDVKISGPPMFLN